MRRVLTLVAMIAVLASDATACALYSVSDEGLWPESWPKELDPLREQSRTLVGPVVAQRHYEIPFETREQFEAAWPKLLSIKTEGAPIILVRGPTRLGNVKAGVWVHTPPEGVKPKLPAKMLQPVDAKSQSRWMNTNFIKLIVDGEIVDLNRIPLPNDCPIIDLRFEEQPQ